MCFESVNNCRKIFSKHFFNGRFQFQHLKLESSAEDLKKECWKSNLPRFFWKTTDEFQILDVFSLHRESKFKSSVKYLTNKKGKPDLLQFFLHLSPESPIHLEKKRISTFLNISSMEECIFISCSSNLRRKKCFVSLLSVYFHQYLKG